MNGKHHPFRVLRKHDTKIMYVAIPDVKAWFEKLKSESSTVKEEAFWDQAAAKLDSMIYEGLDHDL
jgi:hypothetical protein